MADYGRYVTDPGQGVNQGLQSLMQAMQYQQQMERQGRQDAQAKTLHDLQVARLQEEQGYQQGLRGAMSNPGMTFTRGTPQPQASLASLGLGAPEFAPQPPAYNGPMQPGVTARQKTPAQAGAEYAMGQGRYKEAAEMMSLDDAIAQMGAKLQQSGGDLSQYYAAKQSLEEGKQFMDEVTKLGSVERVKAFWPVLQQRFPKHTSVITPEEVAFEPDGIVVPMRMKGEDGQLTAVPNKVVMYGADRKPMVVDTTDKEAALDKRFEQQERMADKRFTQQQQLQAQQSEAQDRRISRQIAASDARAAAKGNKPDGIVVREAVKDLPKLRREARTAEASKVRLAEMQTLLANGSAGGLKGALLSKASTFFDTPATSEADLFKKLASAGAGQLRASVIGPGPVSNYEQQLLQAVSGGGNGARTALTRLLKYYAEEADRTIYNYNDALESAATVAPDAAKAFRSVGGKGGGKGKGKDPLGIL